MKFMVGLVCYDCGKRFQVRWSAWQVIRMKWGDLLAQFGQKRLTIALCKDCEGFARRRYDYHAAHGRFEQSLLTKSPKR